jgi:hypothetical protein
MESLQQTVKITDGMLRVLVQRLSNQIDSMGTTTSPAEITNVGKQLEASLTQVQRVHEQLESTLARVVEHEQATKQAAGQQKDSADSTLVTDNLSKLAAIFRNPATETAAGAGLEGADQSLSRLETKIDALTAKFDKAGEVDERLTAIQSTLLEVKDRAIARVTKKKRLVVDISTSGTTNPSVSQVVGSEQPSLPAPPSTRPINAASSKQTSKATALQLNNPIGNPSPKPAPNPSLAAQLPAASSLTGPDRKRRREGEDPGPAQPLAQPAWSEDQQKKLSKLRQLRKPWESLLDRLVPCPDGGLWEADRIYMRFRVLSEFSSFRFDKSLTTLIKHMDTQDEQTWFCVWRVTHSSPSPSVRSTGWCGVCHFTSDIEKTGCVQVRRAATDGGPLSRYYYVRVMHRPDVRPV